TATATGASSAANASLAVTAFANNNVQGSVRSWGNATVDTSVANAEAFASSTSTFRVRGGTLMKSGRVQWGGFLTATSHGQSTAGIHDPISFDLLDLITGVEYMSELLGIEYELSGDSS